MEEILASIRRIISEDADTSKAPPAAAAPKPAARPAMIEEEDEDVLDLTNKVEDDGSVVNLDRPMERAASPKPAANSLDLDFDLEEDDGKEAAILRHDSDFDREFSIADDDPEPEDDEPQDFSGLMSRASAAAASDAFADLQNVAPAAAARPAPAAPRSNGGVTLEDVVKDALVPVLRDWLDRNLPAMVEEMVQAEIQRLAQQGRRR